MNAQCAMKALRLQRIEELTLSLACYVRDVLPLANQHNCDFIGDDLWNNCLPPSLATELEKLRVEQLVGMSAGRLDSEHDEVDIQAPCDPTAVTTQASYHTEDSLRLCNSKQGSRPKWDKRLKSVWRHQELRSFIQTAHSYTLPQMDVLSSIPDVLSDIAGESRYMASTVHVSHGMSEKKSHEVKVMTDTCGHLADTCDVKHVIDIGSGRGYLGCQLALLYKLRVLGVDSSCSNTDSAAERTKRLNKWWPTLVQHSVEKALNPDKKLPTHPRRRRKKKEQLRHHTMQNTSSVQNPENNNIANEFNPKNDAASATSATETAQSMGIADHTVMAGSSLSNNLYIPVTEFVTEETDLGLLVRNCFPSQNDSEIKISCCEKKDYSNDVSTAVEDLKLESERPEDGVELFDGCKRFMNENDVSQSNSAIYCNNVISQSNTSDCDNNTTDSSHFVSGDNLITMRETLTSELPLSINLCEKTATTLQHQIQNKNGATSGDVATDETCVCSCASHTVSGASHTVSGGILLTGLHTCGDLAGSVLRLYTASTDVRLLCTVGCCYHLISERYLATPMDPPEGSVEPSFPQSRLLRSREYQLGRNARMLACQSADRIAQQTHVETDKWLYWRAVLQLILRDLTREQRDDWTVGRIASKCGSFVEYAKRSLDKLHIAHDLSDADLAEYETRHKHMEARITAFYYLKAVLAPCIEALILLDRLCYVLEQECTAKAHLVQLFDRVTSPRCYAIIATKVS